MNIQEMQLAFLTKLKTDYNIELDIPSIQIEYFLNESQRRVVERYYELFETDEKARKILNYLVVSADLDTATYKYVDQTGVVPSGELWSLPVDCMYILKEEASINLNACENITAIPTDYLRVYVKPINLDYYSKNVGNPFKKPYAYLVWRMDTSNSNGPQLHQLITGGTYRVKIYHITYLAYPDLMSILSSTDCTLPALVHQDIVDGAVAIALEVLQTNKLYKS